MAYGAFLASIVYLMGFLAGVGVPKSVDAGTGPLGPARPVDLLLIVLFGVQHSVMARPAFKRWWTRIVPEPIERSTFVLVSALVLALMFWLWRPIPLVIWEVDHAWAAAAIWSLYVAGWTLAVASTFVLSHAELFGLQQVHRHLTGASPKALPFRTPTLYRIVRHPMHAGMLLALWATPRMTAGHLLFSLGMTAYVLIGIHFEERGLVRQFGDRYLAYCERVPRLLPLRPWGRRGDSSGAPRGKTTPFTTRARTPGT